MKPLHTIAAFVLVLVLLLPLALPFMMRAKILAVQRGMQYKLGAESLHTLSIPLNRVVWVKPGKELRINNHLFDVKSMRIENNMAVFSGLFDEEEKALYEQLADNRQKNTNLYQLLLHFFSLSYDNTISFASRIQTPLIAPVQTGIAGPNRYNPPARLVEAPPPRYS
jgi:hypothetical protein